MIPGARRNKVSKDGGGGGSAGGSPTQAVGGNGGAPAPAADRSALLREKLKKEREEKNKQLGGEQRPFASPATPNTSGEHALRIGCYQLGESLGRGAFGRVYKGLSFKTGQVVAVKQINKDMLTPTQLPSIMQELELLQKLSHQHIVKFIEFFEINEYLYFVLEYVEGGSLHDAMKKFGVFPEELLVLYITHVLLGLEYLHDQNVVHRDIKGCNLLLTKDGQVKLADFGSCTYVAFDKQLSVVGTPFWMAPEIIEMTGGGKCSDVWSVGCTILELLTGQPPYWDAGAMGALFQMVDKEHPPFPRDLSTNLHDFLKKCFVRDPETRPSPTQLLDHPWVTSAVPDVRGLQAPSRKVMNKTIKEYNTKRMLAKVAHTNLADIQWDGSSSPDSGSSNNNSNINNSNNKDALSSSPRASAGEQKTKKEAEHKAKKEKRKKASKNKLKYMEKQVLELTEKLNAEIKEKMELKELLGLVEDEKQALEGCVDELQGTVDDLHKEIAALQQQRRRLSASSLLAATQPTYNIASIAPLSPQLPSKRPLRRSGKDTSPRDNAESGEDPTSSSASSPGSFTRQPVHTVADKDRRPPERAAPAAAVPLNGSSGSGGSPASTSKVCESCGKPIHKNGRLAMGRPYHQACFKCEHCGCVVEEFIEKDGKPYCIADFNSLFGNHCGGCNELITGQYIQAMSNSKKKHKKSSKQKSAPQQQTAQQQQQRGVTHSRRLRHFGNRRSDGSFTYTRRDIEAATHALAEFDLYTAASSSPSLPIQSIATALRTRSQAPAVDHSYSRSHSPRRILDDDDDNDAEDDDDDMEQAPLATTVDRLRQRRGTISTPDEPTTAAAMMAVASDDAAFESGASVQADYNLPLDLPPFFNNNTNTEFSDDDYTTLSPTHTANTNTPTTPYGSDDEHGVYTLEFDDVSPLPAPPELELPALPPLPISFAPPSTLQLPPLPPLPHMLRSPVHSPRDVGVGGYTAPQPARFHQYPLPPLAPLEPFSPTTTSQQHRPREIIETAALEPLMP
eukprot:TRINITY_DN5854_c0_g1_i1.p1 TRINITY_DN5854_c0_g1~~TRINITY_DN5854_c0_g1_i1.p1  ORF type:complete len:1017 (-),score=213.53 TRINITY_DN5854_c0_g1_i1:99-3149(-)